MEKFNMRPESYQEIKKPLIIRLTFIYLLTFVVAGLINHFNPNTKPMSTPMLIGFICLMITIFVYSGFRVLKLNKRMIDTFRVVFDDDTVTREVFNTPTIVIKYADIKKIVKHANGGFAIHGASRDVISFSNKMDNFNALEAKLSSIRAIEVQDKVSLVQRFPLLGGVLVLIVMPIFYISTNKILITVSGTVLFVFLSYSLYVIQTSNNINKSLKTKFWISLVLLVSIPVSIYLRIKG